MRLPIRLFRRPNEVLIPSGGEADYENSRSHLCENSQPSQPKGKCVGCQTDQPLKCTCKNRRPIPVVRSSGPPGPSVRSSGLPGPAVRSSGPHFPPLQMSQPSNPVYSRPRRRSDNKTPPELWAVYTSADTTSGTGYTSIVSRYPDGATHDTYPPPPPVALRACVPAKVAVNAVGTQIPSPPPPPPPVATCTCGLADDTCNASTQIPSPPCSCKSSGKSTETLAFTHPQSCVNCYEERGAEK